MQVILLQRINKLGNLGEMVKVKPGYARNYLIPTGKAKPATKVNLAEFESRKSDYEKAANELYKQTENRAEQIKNKSFVLEAMASEEGKLYGSITAREVCDHINLQSDANLERKEVVLTEGAIRSLGEYDVDIILEGGIELKVKLTVARIAK